MSYQASKIEEHQAQLYRLTATTGKIAFLDEGKGDPILLIHGIPTNSWLYRDLVNPLVSQGHRVIVPDMLGFGASDKPDLESSYAPEMHSHRLGELVDALKLDRFSVVVHDAGGPWSYDMIKERHKQIDNLVFLNTILFPEGFNPPINPKGGSFFVKLLGELYESGTFGKLIVNSTLKQGTSKHKLKRQERRGYWHNLKQGSDAAIRYFFGHLDKMRSEAEEFHSFLESTDHGINIGSIWGMEDDILIGEKQIPLMISELGMKEERIIKLEDVSHFVTEEEPERVAKHICDLMG